MKVFILHIIYVLLFFNYCLAKFSCKTHATILRQLEREGFHIDIHSLIELLVEVEYASRWDNCTVILRENIPDSFYVSPDQLDELHRLGYSDACTLDEVNVESPQYLSNRHTLYVYGRLRKSQNLIYINLKFPIHLRYQKPKSGGGYSAAVLELPALLVRCEDMEECSHLAKTKAPCFYCRPDVCDWMRINYKTNIANFTLPVPVGNSDHIHFVTIITYCLTFGGCFYVTLAMLLNNSNMKHKIN